MGGRVIDIRGDDVRLHRVSLGVRPCARVRKRVDQIVEVEREIAVTQPGRSEHGPERGVRVLRAVLAHAGEISLDVARIVLGVIERRREEQDHALIFAHEALHDGLHRGASAHGLAGFGEHRPALRDRVDLALALERRTERAPVIEVCTPVPRPIPGGSLDGRRVFVGAMTAPVHDGAIVAERRVPRESA